MKFSANKKYWFYPDVNGNLDLPESERLAVEIIRPTAEERGEVSWAEGTPRGKGNETSVRMRFNTSRILRHNVGQIKNLVITETSGEERAVSSGTELAETSFAGMNVLIDVICAEVCSDVITDTQKKISKSDSASSGTDGTSESSGPSTPNRK